MVFLWYPARDGATGQRAEYIPGKWGELAAQNMFPIPARRLREIRVAAIENAPLIEATLRVLIMLPGMGRNPAHYTTLAEDLASYGYLVAGVTPTGSTRPVVFPDGRVVEGSEDEPSDPATAQQLIETWAGDASFAVDELRRDQRLGGRLDDSRIGIFGHSFGGSVAARVAHRDSRFVCAVNLDGAFFGPSPERFEKPLLILESAEGSTTIDRSVCDRDRAKCEIRTFPRARHMNFSDSSILPSRFPLPKSMTLLGDVDGPEFLREVSDQLRGFFGEM
jgi:dienelactone hydrolase